jgi:uncharacterized membrane protein
MTKRGKSNKEAKSDIKEGEYLADYSKGKTEEKKYLKNYSKKSTVGMTKDYFDKYNKSAKNEKSILHEIEEPEDIQFYSTRQIEKEEVTVPPPEKKPIISRISSSLTPILKILAIIVSILAIIALILFITRSIG